MVPFFGRPVAKTRISLDAHLVQRNVGIDESEHHRALSEPTITMDAIKFAEDDISIYDRLVLLVERVKNAPAEEPATVTLDRFLDVEAYEGETLAEIQVFDGESGATLDLIGCFAPTNWKRWQRHHSKVPYDCGTPFGTAAGPVKRLYKDLNIETTTDARKVAARCVMAPSYISANRFENPMRNPCVPGVDDKDVLTKSEAELSDDENQDD